MFIQEQYLAYSKAVLISKACTIFIEFKLIQDEDTLYGQVFLANVRIIECGVGTQPKTPQTCCKLLQILLAFATC